MKNIAFGRFRQYYGYLAGLKGMRINNSRGYTGCLIKHLKIDANK